MGQKGLLFFGFMAAGDQSILLQNGLTKRTLQPNYKIIQGEYLDRV